MATDESMDDDDDDNNDASTDDPCERRSLHGRVEGSPSRGRSSSPHCTRPLDLEHRKAGTPRGGSPRQGGRRGTEEPGNRPAQGSPPQEPEAPQEEPPSSAGGRGQTLAEPRPDPQKPRDTARLPTATAARKSVLDANHEPLRLTHIRNHAHGNQLQGTPWLPPTRPFPKPLSETPCFRLPPAHVHKLEPVPDRGNSHQATHTQQVGSPYSHTRPKTGWGKALSRPLVTPRAGRDGVDGCSPLAGKGADATGLLAVRDPAMLGTPPDGTKARMVELAPTA